MSVLWGNQVKRRAEPGYQVTGKTLLRFVGAVLLGALFLYALAFLRGIL